MPTRAELLTNLGLIANEATPIAITWHVALALVLLALALGWRPTQRVARGLLVGPLGSVAACALAFHNPFNATVFAASATVLVLLSLRGGQAPVTRGSTWSTVIGGALLGYAWLYPHFLTGHVLTYWYAAPLGVIPCPTLALAIGVALLGDGLGGRAYAVVLTGLGLFYGVFGVVRLGVWLDVGLIAGAVALGVQSWRRGRN